MIHMITKSYVIAPLAWTTSKPQCRTLCPGVSASKVSFYDLHDEVVQYGDAWRWQKALLEEIMLDEDRLGSVILLQHAPVYTLGEGSTVDHLRFDMGEPPHPLYRVERGGEVTYHGPGQLVMYPILNLKYLQTDLHWYLRCLEEVVIRALGEVSGISGARVDGLTGVWVGNRKVAAIGIRASRWITYHGLALNVTTDLTPFEQIVPCGISDREVTSVQKLLMENGEDADSTYVQDILLTEYRYGLEEAFREVFELNESINWEVLSAEEASAHLISL